MGSLLRAVVLGAALSVGLGASATGCSLGNVSYTTCTSATQCASTFGPGSTCVSGFCGPPASCSTGDDCRKLAGNGACVGGVCQATIPKSANCGATVYPTNLLSQSLVGPNAPLLIGGIFALSDPKEEDITKAISLAVGEIDKTGLPGGQELGIVFCDNGGAGNTATGDARTQLDDQAVDYLAGTLGAPYILGPLTTSDALEVINEIVKQQYPSTIISPSATGTALTSYGKQLKANDPYPLFWRTCPSDTIQGQVLVTDVIAPNVAVKTLTVIYVDDAYGQGLSLVVQNAFGISNTFLVPFQDGAPSNPAAIAPVVATANGMGGDGVLVITLEGSDTRNILAAMEGLPIATKPFFFADGSMDPTLLASPVPAFVQTILESAQGTAPAAAPGQNFDVLQADLESQFGLAVTSTSFLAQAYDATYVGAFGTLYAISKSGTKYTGVDVATGITHENAGTTVNLDGVSAWPTGSGVMTSQGQIDLVGTSGKLVFDTMTGDDTTGAILIWGVSSDLQSFTTVKIVGG